jgi:hypothetical protein
MAQEDLTTIDTIRDLKRREPFTPFKVIMTSGDRYLIEDGDALAIGNSQLFYCVPRTGHVLHMRLNQIAAVEEIGETSAKS